MDRVDVNPDQWTNHPELVRRTHEQMANEGILIAAPDAVGKLNPMTIGWGMFGWIWSRPIFTVLVRPSRYTYDCVEAAGDFTVNVQPPGREDIANLCGTASGRDHDKMAELDLTPLPSRHISSAGIAECPIVFECKIVHRNDILPPELAADITEHYYPDGDYHRVYFGQIMAISAAGELVGA